MSSDPKITKKIKKEAVLWLFEELPEERRERFETTVKEMPPLQDYVKDMEKTLKLVDELPMKYPGEGTTKKNRVMVTGKIDNYKGTGSISGKLSRIIENAEDFLSSRFKAIISLSALFIALIIGWNYIFPPEPNSSETSTDISSPRPASSFQTKEQTIQGFIDNQTLKVSKIRELRDNTGKITFTIDAEPEIFYVADLKDNLAKNILYFSVRHDENPGTRLNALKILAKDDNDPTLKDLTINILLSEENPGIRLRAIRILEKYPLDNNLKNICIKVLLEDENNVMRMEALARLSQLNETDLVPIYQVVSQYEQNEYIREEAERLLKRIQTDEESET